MGMMRWWAGSASKYSVGAQEAASMLKVSGTGLLWAEGGRREAH